MNKNQSSPLPVIALRTLRNFVVVISVVGATIGATLSAIILLDNVSKWIAPVTAIATLIFICFGVAVAQTQDDKPRQAK